MDAFEKELVRCRLPSVETFQWWEEGVTDTLEVRLRVVFGRGRGWRVLQRFLVNVFV